MCGDIGDLVATGLGALVACRGCFDDMKPTNPNAVACALREDDTEPAARGLDIVDICEPL